MRIGSGESIFEAYDIRGRYPHEINEEVVEEVISKMEKFFGGGKIVVGHDTRLSSQSLYRSALKALRAYKGVSDIMAVGLMTTPMLTFLIHRLEADWGVIITASHNPKDYNGLIIVGREGIPVGGREVLKIVKEYD